MWFSAFDRYLAWAPSAAAVGTSQALVASHHACVRLLGLLRFHQGPERPVGRLPAPPLLLSGLPSFYVCPHLTQIINTQAIFPFGQSARGLCQRPGPSQWCFALSTGEEAATQTCEFGLPLRCGRWSLGSGTRVCIPARWIFKHFRVLDAAQARRWDCPPTSQPLWAPGGFARCSASYTVRVGFFQRRSR